MRHAFLLSLFASAGCSASHATPPEDAARATDTAMSTDASASDGGGARFDTGAGPIDAAVIADVGTDAATRTDTGTGLVPGRITCGVSECSVGNGCLASCLDASDVRTPACVAIMTGGMFPAGNCPSGHEMFPRYWLLCDGAEDCAAGESCHVVYGSSGQFAWCGACASPCDHAAFHLICRTSADCPSDAPRCAPTTDLPGYSTCQP